jgi:hypothetical protein
MIRCKNSVNAKMYPDPAQQYRGKKAQDRRLGPSDKVPANQVQSPEFELHYGREKKMYIMMWYVLQKITI